MRASQVKNQIGEDIWNSYFKFCNIRNPWDKTVSAFHFNNPEIKDKSQDDIINLFREWLPKRSDLMLDTPVYYIDNKPVVNDTIRYETLEADLNRICSILNIHPEKLSKSKSEYRGNNRIPFQNYYNSNCKEIIEELYRLEIEDFGWSFD